MSMAMSSAVRAIGRAPGVRWSVLSATAQEFQEGITDWPQRVQSTAAFELKIAATCVGERVMRGALNEADRHHGDHALGGTSIKGRNGSRQPCGQSADYYPLIIQAVSRLEPNSAETRRKIYDRARAAMVAQLRSVTPSLGESDIGREQLALERAIRQVEAENILDLDTATPPPIRLLRRSPTLTSDAGTAANPMGAPSRRNAVAGNDDRGHPTLATRLTVSPRDLSDELELLQNQIRHRNRRGGSIVQRLVSLAVLVLLVVVAAAPAAL
jgi:hypothetical protein